VNNATEKVVLEEQKKERFSRLKKVGRRIVHVLNPVSGSSRFYKKAIETVNEFGGDMIVSEHSGHITELVRNTLAKDPSAHLVVYGGDGSVYETVNGIMASGAADTAILSVVPSGTGNDFAKYANDCDELLAGEITKIDLIKTTCGDDVRYFDNMMNIGFDCAVVDEATKIRRTGMFKGPSAYLAGVAKTLTVKTSLDVKILLEGCVDLKAGNPLLNREINKRILLTTCSNARFCGGGFRSSPLAKVTDGLLDVLVVNDVSIPNFAAHIKRYRSGTYISEDGVILPTFESLLSYFRCRKMTVSGAKRFCLDGEVFDTNGLPVVAEIVPQAINFVAI